MPASSSRRLIEIIRILGQAAGLGLALALILALSYLLGHSMLTGSLQGNDSPLHVAYATWLNEHFPRIPHWFPTQGGGESLLHGYPVAPHMLLVILHRITGISILQVYRIVSFGSFPLIAFGLYLYGWGIFRKQAVGLVAAVLYLLSPVSWTWMYNWGFFSQQVGLLFLPLALLAFQRAHECQFSSSLKGRGRVWLVVLVLIMLAATFAHLLVATAAGVGMVLHVILFGLLTHRERRTQALRKGIKVLAVTGAVLAITAAAYIVPFYRYGQVANREGLNTPAAHQLHRVPALNFLGLEPITGSEIIDRMQFPALVTGLAIVGAAFAWRWRQRKGVGPPPLATSITAALATAFTLAPALPTTILRTAPLLIHFLNFRTTLLLVMFLLPAIAAFGTWGIARTLIAPRELFGASAPQNSRERSVWDVLVAGVTSGLTLVIAIGGLAALWQKTYDSSMHTTFGPLNHGLDPNDIWGSGEDQGLSVIEQLEPDRWPPWTAESEDLGISGSRAVAELLPDRRHLRIDISPHEGRYAMDVASYAGASQINSYSFQLSLIHAMWGYQQNVFYTDETGVTEYGSPTTLNNSAKWFGVGFVVLDPGMDAVEMYEEAGWELYEASGGFEIWQLPNSPGMATATTRPTALVISKPETDAYMIIHRIANQGFLNYEDLLLVEGSRKVDDYTLEELNRFDSILLYGHDYRNSGKAWDLLRDYVENGGGLYVDTGWEYWIPEWEFDPAPEVLPIGRALWTDYGPASEYDFQPLDGFETIDVAQFKPLIWEGQAWTLSGAEADDVKDWGEVVLAANGRPLVVAGQYGAGRVVWSGMNLLGHARYGDPTEEEFKLFGNLVKWAAAPNSPSELAEPAISRPHPDEINLLVSNSAESSTWLYWREAYYPNWKAYVADSAGKREVPIYRAGPGFMLMPIESLEPEAIVQLRWELPLIEQLAFVASGLGILMLIALALDGLLLSGNGFTWFKIAVLMRIPRPFLGDGSNREWAERKRRQLNDEAHRVGETPEMSRIERDVVQDSDLDPALEPELADGDSRAVAQEQPNRIDTALEPGFEAEHESGELTPEQQELLTAWLQNGGSQEDSWAEDQLKKRRLRPGR